MKQKITFGVFIMLNLLTATVCVKAQTNADTIAINKQVTSTDSLSATTTLLNQTDHYIYNLTVIEKPATFRGGERKMFEYLSKNKVVPNSASTTTKNKTVYVGFAIDVDGSIVDVAIIRSVDTECDAEALRLIKSMPKWKPGKNQGKPVKMKYTLPVKFN